MTSPRALLAATMSATLACGPPAGAADSKSAPDPYAHPGLTRPLPPANRQNAEPPATTGQKGATVKKPDQPKSESSVKPGAAASPSTPPVEDKWSESEIAEAKARCTAVLKGVEYVAVPEPPMRSGACGAPAPVQLISIGRNPEVTFSPPPVLTCEMVKALDDWMKGDLQKLAKAHLGAPVIRIETMSSYSCRNAYGRARSKLSEHGLANAIDIGGFVTATAVTTRVLGNWGLTQREIRAQAIAAAKAAEEKAKAERAAAEAAAKAKNGQPAPGSGSGGSNVAIPALRIPVPRPDMGGEGFGMAPNHLGGPESKSKAATQAAVPPATGAPIKPEPASRDQRFLRAAHGTACKYFGTVLGPEANFAHHNHFHLDMAPRRTGNFCE